MATRLEIAELYVATFNRAADADGLAYWITDGTSATTTLTSLEDLSAAMIESAEYTTLYPTGTADEAFVIALYSNVLGRTVDATDTGVIYWVAGLADGTLQTNTMVTAIINGAKADTGSATDKATIENKATIGLAYADAGYNDVATATTVMAGVTDNSATVAAAQSTIDALPPVVDGETQTLTTGTDVFTGTALSDYFDATADNTLTDADVILDSVTTDNDIMKATVTTASVKARLSNIETIEIQGKYTTTGLDLANVSGTTDLKVDTSITGGTATVINASTLNAETITSGANVTALNVNATASGTRDTVAVVGGSANVTLTGGAGQDKFETTTTGNVTIVGTAAIDAITANLSDATTTITGDGTLGSLTINQTTAAGVITLAGALTGNVATTSSTTVTGDQDVTIKTTTARITNTAMSNTGSGTLTVNVTDTAAAVDLVDVQANLIEFSSARTVGTTTNVNSSIKVSADFGANMILEQGKTTGSTTALGDGAGTLVLEVAKTQSNQILTGDKVGTALLNAGVDALAAASATITINDFKLSAFTNTLVISGAEDLKLTTLTTEQDTANVITASNMTGNLTIGTLATYNDATATGTTFQDTFVLGSGNDTISAVGSTTIVVHANDGDDKITLTGAKIDSTVNGGNGNDTIIGATTGQTAGGNAALNGDAGNDTITGAANADNINGGDGNDTIKGLGGIDVITGGAGDDTITAGAGADKITLGAGNDTVVIAAADSVTVTAVKEVSTVTVGALTASQTLIFDGQTITDQGAGATAAAVAAVLGGGTDANLVLSGSLSTTTISVSGTTATYTATAAGTAVDLVLGGTGAGASSVSISPQGVDAVAAADDTISDFVVADDTIVLTGAVNTATTITVADATNASGVYSEFGLDHTFTLTGITATDLTDVVQLGSSTAAFDLLANSTITAGSANDNITAASNNGANTISLGAGDDKFTGGTGVDTITGGAGNDTFVVGATAKDVIKDLSGSDILTITDAGVTATVTADFTATASTSTAAITVNNSLNLSNGVSIDLANATVTDVTKGYTIKAMADGATANTSASTITGSEAADIITGSDAADTIKVNGGVDDITGGKGADMIDLTEQVTAVDTIHVDATSGVDVITGLGTNDIITGGAGAAVAGIQNDTATGGNVDYSGSADLAAATAAAYENNLAVTFSYDSKMYVVVDSDNVDGYTTGTDYAVEIVGTAATSLVAANFHIA